MHLKMLSAECRPFWLGLSVIMVHRSHHTSFPLAWRWVRGSHDVWYHLCWGKGKVWPAWDPSGDDTRRRWHPAADTRCGQVLVHGNGADWNPNLCSGGKGSRWDCETVWWDYKTVSLHSPNSRLFVWCQGCGTDYQWPLKNGRNFHQLLVHLRIAICSKSATFR